MKLISLLLALLIIGYLITQQTNKPSPNEAIATDSASDLAAPKVPQRPQDVQKFEQDINKFINDAQAKRDREQED